MKHNVYLLLSAALLALGAPVRAEAFTVTNPRSTWKVLPERGDAGPEAKTLRIAMSRGEYESVQVVVQAGDRALKAVRVSVGNLLGPNGTRLLVEQTEVNPMAYITCKTPGTGWTPLLKSKGGQVPDVLLPNRPMDVPKGRRQPFYVTVRTLRTDQAGLYRGTVRITNSEEARELPLLVRVYDIVLPVRSHLRTAFGLDTAYRKIRGANPGEDLDTLIRYAKFFLAHRITPIVYGDSYDKTGMPPRQREDGSWDFSGTRKFLSELVPLGLTSFYTHGGAGTPAYAGHLKAGGWYDLSYVYMFDEAKIDQLPRMRNQYENMRLGVPEVKILQTAWSPSKQLEGLVNIWCPRLDHAFTDALRRARERGEETWWYTYADPPHPFPNIAYMDYPGIHARITGWVTYHYKIQGFLYFAADIWSSHNNAPAQGRLTAEEYDRTNFATWHPETYKRNPTRPRNGDGYLIYPGVGRTPLASLRLALTRDGFEDYDLLKEVEVLAKGEAATQARNLLRLDEPLYSPIVVSSIKWTKADHLLLRRREAILMAAEEIRRPENRHLQSLRKKTDLDVLYAAPARDTAKKKTFAFGATPPAKARYLDGTDCEKLLPKLKVVEKLPLDGWSFKADPKGVGVEQGYFRPDYPIGGWSTIKIGDFWDSQGYVDLQQGWYRLTYKYPDLAKGKRVYLLFEAVDESLWLYVDGRLVAWYDTEHPTVTWLKPFLLDVTDRLKVGAEHVLAMRVVNVHGAGGIWKPISLMAE